MKTILTTLSLVCIFTACSTRPNEKLISQYEEDIIKDLNDPDTYEFASFEFVDTVFEGDLLNDDFVKIEQDIKDQQYKLGKAKIEMKYASTSESIDRWHEIAEGRLKIVDILETEKDSIIDLYKETKDIPHQYIALHSYRNTNAMGAKMKNESKIAFDTSLTFVEILPADFNLLKALRK